MKKEQLNNRLILTSNNHWSEMKPYSINLQITGFQDFLVVVCLLAVAWHQAAALRPSHILKFSIRNED